jgi:hypothetical protein
MRDARNVHLPCTNDVLCALSCAAFFASCPAGGRVVTGGASAVCARHIDSGAGPYDPVHPYSS